MHAIRSAALIIAAVLQIVFAIAPSLVGIEGSIGETAERNRTILVPAGYAFSIWLILYIGGIYVALWHAFRPRNPVVHRAGWLAILAFSGNAVWALHQPVFGPGLMSFVILECILVFAIWAGAAGRAELEPSASNRTAYGFLLALGGWITVASPAGLSLAFGQAGMWPLFGDEQAAALIILGIWALIALALAFRLAALAYIIPIVWGLYAVIVMNQERPTLTMTITGLCLVFPIVTLAGKWARRPAAA
ncbi:MAG: hypothetical protein AAF830_00165 [Pseudomonadota bacterium]